MLHSTSLTTCRPRLGAVDLSEIQLLDSLRAATPEPILTSEIRQPAAPLTKAATMLPSTSAGSYYFDPSSGLSQDPSLPAYMQNLTPGQLQTALDGGDPAPGLISLLNQDLTATGTGSLPCGTLDAPLCGTPSNTSDTVLIVLAVAAGALLIWSTRK